MVFQDFLSFLVFLETSEVAGPGPNPREIDISFGADHKYQADAAVVVFMPDVGGRLALSLSLHFGAARLRAISTILAF